ncbi:MAG: hypothetical protein BVN35_00345 [Proteobacteria bacterium ST_bin11]|nr:MAG: hypothetical protein BVN35_00345 [Proteobacteria bacterium ST_bin11]
MKYSDILEFRQTIEKQLNKVEISNKFSKGVSFGHSSDFMQNENEDQEIGEICLRMQPFVGITSTSPSSLLQRKTRDAQRS